MTDIPVGPWWFELYGLPCMLILLSLSVVRVADWRDLHWWLLPLAVVLASGVAWLLEGVTPAIATAIAAAQLGFSALATVLTWMAARNRGTGATEKTGEHRTADVPVETAADPLEPWSDIARALPSWWVVAATAGMFALVFGLWLQAMPWWFSLYGIPCLGLMMALTAVRVRTWRDARGWTVPLLFILTTDVLDLLGGVTPLIANALAASLLGFGALATVLAWMSSRKALV